MSYQATVYNVMISAPSDVTAECEAAREVIYAWNAANSEHRKKVLLPVDWKNNTRPQAGTAAQKSINRQIVDKASILIAIFKHRLGQSTDNAVSGTVEEIQEVLKADKPVLLYFSGEPVPQQVSLSDQWKALCEFKEKSKNEDYFYEFDDISSLRSSLGRHIAMIANDLPETSQRPSKHVVPIDKGSMAAPLPEKDKNLNESALELLMAAAQGNNGRIEWRRDVAVGSFLQAGQKNFPVDNDPRLRARLEDAIERLEDADFIRSSMGHDEFFTVTQKGYDFVDSQSK
jgi:hypothetical protein